MDPTRHRTPPWAWALGALGLAGLIGVGIALGWIVHGLTASRGAGRPEISDTPSVVRQVQALNELSTVKYVLEKVVLLEDVKWYGENRLLMIAHGIVRAGVNLDRLRPSDVILEGRRLRVTLPRASISEVFLDDHQTRVIERTTGLLRDFDKDLEQDARRQAVDQLRLAAQRSGILKDADERARLQVGSLLRTLGFVDVEVTSAR